MTAIMAKTERLKKKKNTEKRRISYILILGLLYIYSKINVRSFTLGSLLNLMVL